MDREKIVTAIVWLLALIPLALSVDMALISRPDAHPDEAHHLDAGRYYVKYWDPPRAGDERTLESLSKYGISYLNQFESVYFMAGKFAAPLIWLGVPDYLALRFFNIALFAGLILMGLSLPGRARFAFAPLMISPQIWYIMSYFNGDALPLFLSFIPVRMAARGSFPFLEDEDQEFSRWRLAGLFAVAALIFTCKMNYYVFLAYLFALPALILILRGRAKKALSLLAAGLALGLVLLAARTVHEHLVNDEGTNKTSAVAEQFAEKDFKPSSQDIGVAHFGMRMRDMGLAYKDLFVVWDWHIWTFRTTVGTYDYMKIYAPFIYYRYMGWALTALALAAFIPIIRLGREGALSAALFVVFALACIFQSTWHSWVNDFQAQGRYLFPIAGMGALVLARHPRQAANICALAAALAAYALSIYSFIWVGLAGIPR